MTMEEFKNATPPLKDMVKDKVSEKTPKISRKTQFVGLALIAMMAFGASSVASFDGLRVNNVDIRDDAGNVIYDASKDQVPSSILDHAFENSITVDNTTVGSTGSSIDLKIDDGSGSNRIFLGNPDGGSSNNVYIQNDDNNDFYVYDSSNGEGLFKVGTGTGHPQGDIFAFDASGTSYTLWDASTQKSPALGDNYINQGGDTMTGTLKVHTNGGDSGDALRLNTNRITSEDTLNNVVWQFQHAQFGAGSSDVASPVDAKFVNDKDDLKFLMKNGASADHSCVITESGTLNCDGAKNAVWRNVSINGTNRTLYAHAVESARVWLERVGTATTSGGTYHFELGQAMSSIVSQNHTVKVQVTPRDPCNIYVKDQTWRTFTVKTFGQNGGMDKCTFNWELKARRKGMKSTGIYGPGSASQPSTWNDTAEQYNITQQNFQDGDSQGGNQGGNQQ